MAAPAQNGQCKYVVVTGGTHAARAAQALCGLDCPVRGARAIRGARLGAAPARRPDGPCRPAAGVVSGLGKGVTASSIGVLLKASGYRVSCIKIGVRAARRRPAFASALDNWPPVCCARARAQTRTSTRMRAPCRPSSTARCSCWTTAARRVGSARLRLRAQRLTAAGDPSRHAAPGGPGPGQL